MTDKGGPGQALAKAITELGELLTRRSRGCSITIRWISTHSRMEGNEVADSCAKWAAEAPHDTVDREYVRKANFAPLPRKTTDARSQCTREWIRDHAKGRRRYLPGGRGGKTRKDLQRKRKEVASRYYQLRSGHGPIGSYLAEMINAVRSSACW